MLCALAVVPGVEDVMATITALRAPNAGSAFEELRAGPPDPGDAGVAPLAEVAGATTRPVTFGTADRFEIPRLDGPITICPPATGRE